MPFEWSATGTITYPAPAAPLLLDLEADTLALADDDPVDTWPDESGNNNDALGAGGGANSPVYKATAGPGGKPCVRFDGVDFMNLTSNIPSGSYTMFAVVKRAG